MNKKEYAKQLRQNLLDMLSRAKAEVRELTDEEQKQFDEQKNELLALSEEIKAVDDKLTAIEEEIPEVTDTEAPSEEPEAPVEPQTEEPEQASCPPDDEEKRATEDEKPENTEENKDSEEPENASDDPEINNTEEESNSAEEPAKDDKENDEENKKSNNRSMKDFSLIKAIRSVVDGTAQDEVNKAVIEAGNAEFRSAGLSANGQIQLPGEKRTLTVATEHDDVIETDFESILQPLYAKSALAASGATFMTGLVGDVQIPIMNGKNQVGWAGELDNASETTNTFTSKKMSPHRITAYLDISKQMLAQDSIGVEAAVRADIINALNDKLESTFLGAGDGSITTGSGETAQTVQGVAPKGILNGKSATSVGTYAALCDFEAGLEMENIYNPARYILSPKAKAALRAMNYGGKTTGMVMDTPNSVDGTPAVSTTHIDNKKFIYGDFSVVKIGQWSGIDLTVDAITQATRGAIRIVINAYFDCIVTRPEALLYGTIA